MEAGLIVLGLLSVLFFAIKRLSWPPTVWNHESFCWLPYWTYGNLILPYFRYFAMPLGMYLTAVSYGRSIRFGRTFYDAILAFNGFALGAAVIVLVPQPDFPVVVASLVVLALSYCVFLPLVTTEGGDPEIYGYAFAALGFALTCLGLDIGSTFLVVLGCGIAGMVTWVKISITEGLWSPVAVLVLQGTGGLFAASCVVYLFMLGIYPLLVGLGIRKANAMDTTITTGFSELVRLFLAGRKRDMRVRYTRGTLAKISSFVSSFARHFVRVAPLVVGYAVFLCDPGFQTGLKSLTVLMIGISMLHPLVRLFFHPLYVFMGHFPLAFGAALAIVSHRDWLASSPWWSIAGCVLVILWAVLGLRRNSVQRNITEKTTLIQQELLEPLAEIVQPNQWIFQDGYTVMLYLAFKCRGPGRQFLWMNYTEATLSDEVIREKLLDYFRIRQPAYYFAQRRCINLSTIEKYTGLRYTLLKTGYIYAYVLRNVVEPHAGTPSYEELFAGSEERFATDKQALLCAEQ